MMYEMQREGIYEVEFKTLVLHQREPEFPPTKIDSSSTAIPILKAIFGNLDADQEHFVVLFLNNANRVTGAKVLFSGAMDKANVDTRVILRNALLFGATAIIIAHSHTSGNVTPSIGDQSVTALIKEAATVLSIKLLDHIILSPRSGEYYSFLDEGELCIF